MKKPSFSAALAQDASLAQGSDMPDPVPAPALTPVKVSDGRVNTTLRISPQGLEALKIVAASKRCRVNDLLLEGAEHVLALNGRKMQLRK